MKLYDVIIIGGGPAGLAAAIYAARYKLKTLVYSAKFGGQIVETDRVENYPGFKMISGYDLMKYITDQCRSFGVEIIEEEVKDIAKSKNGFKVSTESGQKEGKYIVLAQGNIKRKLNVPGEEEFWGRGVSSCATCDCTFFKDKIVAVVGGGDSAALSGIILAEHASKVYVLIRKKEMRAEPAWQEDLKRNKKVEIMYNTEVKKINGDKKLTDVELSTGKKLKLDGLFIDIGFYPNTELAKKLGVKLDEQEYIVVDDRQRTNVQGVYAAGDFTTSSGKYRQLLCAMSEGAVCINSIFGEIKRGRA